jgi:hypothetical protein
MGLVLLGLADQGARISGSNPQLPLFWAGILLIVGTGTWHLVGDTASRDERIAIVVTLGLALYLIKVMSSPIGFTLPDEFSHWRTLDEIIHSDHVFAQNPLLPISAVYPGLEAATAAIQSSTGIDTFSLAILVIGGARAITMIALFLIATAITGSSRVAGVASVVYMSNTSFLPFDAQYAYESLALPLAMLAIWSVLRWWRHQGRSVLHAVIAVSAIAATAMTHHLTSLVLLAFLTVWAVLSLGRWGNGRPRWPVVLAAGWAVLANVGWFLTVGDFAIGYLDSVVLGGIEELLSVLTGSSAPKQLFAARAGFVLPVPEMVAAYAAVILLNLALPLMLWHAVWRRRPSSITLVLALAALLYPGSLALRFTAAGSETSQRAAEFLFIALGVLGADWLVGSRPARWRPRGQVLVVSLVLTVFAGGIVSGDPPQGRLPAPYHVAAEQLSIEPQGTDTAAWALEHLGPNNRLVADRTNAKLLGSIGGQYPVTAANEHLGTAYLMFNPTLTDVDLDLMRRAAIRYVVVDLRLSRDVPVYKYYFENAEPDAGRHTTPIPLASLQKFDGMDGVTRIYDSGDIIIYDVRALVDAPH